MRAKEISSEPFELNALRELSARIGHNPLLVQASSGNTSVKIDELLWIKASGKWLIHAEEEDFLVSVNLTKAKQCLSENTAIPETETTSPDRLRASIETAKHAALPQKVVVHVHSVNTIAWAVREDGPRQLSTRLAGLRWQWIPYIPSGNSLARKIEHVLSSSPQTDVLVLGNHGLVVCGNSCCSAELLLLDVERRLTIDPRPAPEPRSVLPPPGCAGVHALATDHISRRILSGGVLYPCQAIFLPETMPVPASSLPSQERYDALAGARMTRAEQEMLVGLANVVQRIDGSAPIRYLTASEVVNVLNGEVDHYRRVTDLNGHPQTLMPVT
ncbi:MAG: class II aldolase/adducin family protein [Acidobacteriota bacterium]|nr:class II aldolase/adducin family protein [Acidobacteriota bacterium]